MGDHYVLKVVRSSIGEVVGDREVTLSSHPYYNPNAATTRSAAAGFSAEGAKYVDDNNVIHPTAITLFEAQPGLMFGVDVIVDKVAGPKLAIGPRLKFKAELSYTRWVDGGSWDFNAEASAGLGGEFGAKVKVFGWELAEWKYPFDIGKQKPIFKYPEE